MLDLIMGSAQRKRLQAVITNDTGSTELTEVITQIQVTASGGTMYEWDGGLTPLLPTNTFIEPGTYTVTVRQSNGIPATASIIITQETPPTPEPEFDIYIDPDNNSAGRDGSMANPYRTLAEAGGLADNTSYGFRAGSETVLVSELSFANRTNTLIGVYDAEETDYLFKLKADLSGTCAVRFANSTNCTLMGFDLYSDLSISLLTLIQGGAGTGFNGGSGNIVANGKIHGVKQGTSDGGMGMRIGGNGWNIIGVEVYDAASDGIYARDATNINIRDCNIHHINQNYAGASIGFNSLGNSAGGDGIQLDGDYDGFTIANTIVDRSDIYTGNKYCMILNSAAGVSDNSTGIIEGCTFLSKKSNIYASIHIERGNGIITRYNRFEGNEMAIYVAGKYTSNNLIHHNIFVGYKRGVGVGSTYGGDPGPATGTKVYNNVFYKVSQYHVWVDNSNVETRNNIHLRSGDSGVALYNYGGGSWTISNNCYGDLATAGVPGTGTNSVIGDPKFVNAATGDFHLQSDSPCRTAGYDVGLDFDFDGVAIPSETMTSIGAFEYVIL